MIVADFRAIYQISGDDLWEIDSSEFMMLLQSLDPDRSVYLRVIAAEPEQLSEAEGIALIDSL